VVLLTVALVGTGTTYAASPKNDSRLFESSRFAIVLQDSGGFLWGLDIYFGCVLYGVFYAPAVPLLWPAYGFIFGNDMVLWADGTGVSPYVDSFAYVGAWDFAKMTYTGNWVNFVFPTTSWAGSVQMWLYGTKSSEATKTGPNPSVAASNIQGRGINPGVATSGGRAKTLQDMPLAFAFADSTDRGAYKFTDSFGFLWDLDLLLGIIYYGTITYSATEKWPAFGFRNDGEMFLWANAPEGGLYTEFVYIGKYNSADRKYYGAWANYGTGNGLVTWWAV